MGGGNGQKSAMRRAKKLEEAAASNKGERQGGDPIERRMEPFPDGVLFPWVTVLNHNR